MICFTLKLLAPLFILFALVALLIRAQAYDDHDLWALLTPDNCEMPCFMGIRPGVTTADDAVKLLEANSWVKQVKSHSDTFSATFYWTWSGQQPPMINEKQLGFMETQTAQGGVVTSLTIATTIPLGLVFLDYGPADWMAKAGLDNTTRAFEFGYVAKKLAIGVEDIRCASWSGLFAIKVNVTYEPTVRLYPLDSVYNVGLESLRQFTPPFGC